MKRIMRLWMTAAILSCLFTFGLCDGITQEIVYGVEPGGLVSIHTPLQEQYLADKPTSITKYADGTAQNSCPASVTISWPGMEGAERLYLSEDADFTNPIIYDVAGLHQLDVYNLKLGTTYCWKLVGVDSDVQSFQTAQAIIRPLRVDGVTNIRDLGGYETSSGQRVKQGLLFRSAKFNADDVSEAVPLITPEGIHTMREELHIRTEIDLRRSEDMENGGLQQSVLGEDINYQVVPMRYSSSSDAKFNPLVENAESIRLLFSILADESNYPIVFHCSVGTDRTGMVAYLINGLLGVSDADLMVDYLFSNFGDIGYARQATALTRSMYVQHIKKCEGETLSERISNALLGIGVQQSELDAVVAIMTE